MGPSVTLNLGLRWEYGSPAREEYGRLVNLDITPGFGSAAPVTGYAPTGALTHTKYPDSLMQPDKHGVEPRVSFAWKPIFGASTVVRGGYGVYYNTSVYQPIVTNMVPQPPLSRNLNFTNSFANPWTMANAFTASGGFPTYAVDPNLRVGYSQNWQLSVQQNVTASMVLTATYLGIKGTRAAQTFLPIRTRWAR